MVKAESTTALVHTLRHIRIQCSPNPDTIQDERKYSFQSRGSMREEVILLSIANMSGANRLLNCMTN